MALQFQGAPEWLLQEYMQRKQPAEIANEGIGTAIQGYAKASADKQQKQAAATANLLKLIETDPELRNTPLGKRLLAQSGGSLEGYQPPGASTGTVPSPQQLPQAAGPVEGQAASSPVLDHWNQTMSKSQGPVAANVTGLQGRGKLGKQAIGEMKTSMEMQKLSNDLNPQATPYFDTKGAKLFDLPPGGKMLNEGTPRGMQFVGTQNEQAVLFDPNTGKTSYTALPGTGAISPKVSPTLPGAEVSKFGELGNLKQKMSVLRQNYKPEYVGMLDAPMQALKQKTGFGASKEAAFFKQTSQDIKDSLLRARSGAQINEQEYQRLLPLVPNETMSEVDFLAKSDRFDQVLDEMMRSKQQAFQAAGYRTPQSFGTGPTGGQPTSTGGLDPVKKARLEQLRAKKAAGTLR